MNLFCNLVLQKRKLTMPCTDTVEIHRPIRINVWLTVDFTRGLWCPCGEEHIYPSPCITVMVVDDDGDRQLRLEHRCRSCCLHIHHTPLQWLFDPAPTIMFNTPTCLSQRCALRAREKDTFFTVHMLSVMCSDAVCVGAIITLTIESCFTGFIPFCVEIPRLTPGEVSHITCNALRVCGITSYPLRARMGILDNPSSM